MDDVLNAPLSTPELGTDAHRSVPLPVVAAEAVNIVMRPWHRLGGPLVLLRPRQWIKGGLVLLAPLAAAPQLAVSHAAALALTLVAFLSAASAVYVFNDLKDRDRDRLHLVKRHRPLASGRVSSTTAIGMLVGLLVGTAVLAALLPPLVGALIGGYLVMNLWYTLSLKHQPLVDVSIVATGFVLRVLAGALAVGLAVQPPLLVSVYCACLALSLGKRRHELAALTADGSSAAGHRPSLGAYSVSFLDHIVVVNLVAALGGYVAFIWMQDPPYGPVTVALTFPFAAFTVSRYLQMVTVDSSGGDPAEDLVHDRALLVNLGLWVATLVASAVIGLH
jgi:decaprenyl-phosphate phosphoribosyltransferase